MYKLVCTITSMNLRMYNSLLEVTSNIIRCRQPIRKLNLLECESKNLLRNFGVNVQHFVTIKDMDNINDAAKKIKFDADEYVIKAQILAGGRGLGVFDNGYKGGVQVVDKRDDIEGVIMNMLGRRLTTKQTSKSGALVKSVMVATCLKIRRETYFCILLDSSRNGPIIIATPNGGTDIEDTCEGVKIFPINITDGVTTETANDIATHLKFDEKTHEKAAKQIISVWNTFKNTDAVQIEINPFAETKDGEIFAIDAKIQLDDNASFRHENIFKTNQEINNELDEREVRAANCNLNYVGLDGNIGCLVNGAGLAMATMDLIKLNGGEPANFLDVGGSVTKQQVSNAIKILVSDDKLKSIFINIFGGIVDCRIIADGIINAMENTAVDIPLIVRLKGNNVDQAKKALTDVNEDFKIHFADDFHEAAQLAIVFKKNNFAHNYDEL